MKKVKILLSTGIGPLHFMKSAVFLSKIVDITVIQSWIPKNTDGKFVKILSKIVGHPHLATGLKKRTPPELDGRNFSCAFPDFFLWGFNVVSKIFNYPNRKQIAGWGWKLYGRESKKYIQDADVFHVRSGAGQGGAIKKAKKEGMKVLVDHSIAHPAYMDQHLSHEYKKNGALFNLGMNSPLFQYTVHDAQMSDLILVNSFFVKNTFVEHGFKESKIRVVYLGVREDFIGLKTKYSSEKKIKLLFTGGFGFRKGAEYLLMALQRLEKEGFLFEMKIVGAYEESLALLKKHPVKSMELIGFVPQDELKGFLKEADIYIFPSLCEGCASSGMEALAAGLPVIATEESGFPIEHNKDGIIILSKNYMEIVSAIKELSKNKEKREYLGKNASTKIKHNYTWNNYSKNVNDIYIELLDING